RGNRGMPPRPNARVPALEPARVEASLCNPDGRSRRHASARLARGGLWPGQRCDVRGRQGAMTLDRQRRALMEIDMVKLITRLVSAVVMALGLGSVAECQLPPPWISHALYSNVDGTVQFMVIEITGWGQPVSLAGQTLVTSDGFTEHTFTFTRD